MKKKPEAIEDVYQQKYFLFIKEDWHEIFHNSL